MTRARVDKPSNTFANRWFMSDPISAATPYSSGSIRFTPFEIRGKRHEVLATKSFSLFIYPNEMAMRFRLDTATNLCWPRQCFSKVAVKRCTRAASNVDRQGNGQHGIKACFQLVLKAFKLALEYAQMALSALFHRPVIAADVCIAGCSSRIQNYYWRMVGRVFGGVQLGLAKLNFPNDAVAMRSLGPDSDQIARIEHFRLMPWCRVHQTTLGHGLAAGRGLLRQAVQHTMQERFLLTDGDAQAAIRVFAVVGDRAGICLLCCRRLTEGVMTHGGSFEKRASI